MDFTVVHIHSKARLTLRRTMGFQNNLKQTYLDILNLNEQKNKKTNKN